MPTEKSEVSHGTLGGKDGNTWEQLLAAELELNGNVAAYVKNDHLGFTVPYVPKGRSQSYLSLTLNDPAFMLGKSEFDYSATQLDAACWTQPSRNPIQNQPVSLICCAAWSHAKTTNGSTGAHNPSAITPNCIAGQPRLVNTEGISTQAQNWFTIHRSVDAAVIRPGDGTPCCVVYPGSRRQCN